MPFLLFLLMGGILFQTTNGDCPLCNAPTQKKIKETEILAVKAQSSINDLVHIATDQTDIQFRLTQDINVNSTNYTSIHELTLIAIQAEQFSIQLVDLIDTAIKTSSKVEARAYESNILASFQANSAALCDPNPCHKSECIVDFLAGSFKCNCNSGYYGSLLSVFSNPTIQSTITQLNGTSFGGLNGFGMYSSSTKAFNYLMDYVYGIVYILNDEWSFISFKTFRNPYNMISIDNGLYMIGISNVWKVDQDLNILINYGGYPLYPLYRGISYNPSNSLIYVVNKLFVGTEGGIILVYQKEEKINQFNGCDGNSEILYSILFDTNGFMATTCQTNKLYLFSPEGSFTGKTINTPNYPDYIGFDSKDRFIQISAYQINIYN